MRVYKFIGQKYGLEALVSNTIKVSKIEELNDPFELLAMSLEDRNIRKSLNFWKLKFSKETGLISFSNRWSNPVIWSHYADSHKGMALGFDISSDDAIEVKYGTHRLASSLSTESINNNLLLKHKFAHWKYEAEARLLKPLSECVLEDRIYKTNFGDGLRLREVILGHKYMPANKTELQANLASSGVEITQARLAFKSFSVVRQVNKELWKKL